MVRAMVRAAVETMDWFETRPTENTTPLGRICGSIYGGIYGIQHQLQGFDIAKYQYYEVLYSIGSK